MKDRLPVKSGVELAPLVDVIFLLLAYLLLNSTLARLPSIEIDLPASGAAVAEERTGVDIWIDAEGAIAMNGAPVALEDLGARVTAALDGQAAGDDRPTPIAIRADRRAAYHRVVAVLDELNAAGHRRFQLMTNKDPGTADR